MKFSFLSWGPHVIWNENFNVFQWINNVVGPQPGYERGIVFILFVPL